MLFMHKDSSNGWCVVWALLPKFYLGRSIFFMHEDPPHGQCASEPFWTKSDLREACSLCIRIHLIDCAERCTGDLARSHFE